MRIDPRLVIEFAVIAEERSFTKAAARLRVAQPWLSVRLHKLETLLGFRLFVRTTRTVTLTEQGAEFLNAAREVQRSTDAVNALAEQIRRSHVQRLRIGAAPYTKFLWSRRDLIDRFLMSETGVSLELETGWSLSLLERLQSGQIDLAFMMGAFDENIFQGVRLCEVGVSLTFDPDHPLAGLPLITPDTLTGLPIHVFTRSLNPKLWDDLYAPLMSIGARFVEIPEMAEGAPDVMTDTNAVAAFFDFGAGEAEPSRALRRPLATAVTVPFSLLRRMADLSPAGDAFWRLANVHH